MTSNNLTDDTIDALIAGHGHEHDPELAELLASVRATYTSIPLSAGTELAAILTTTEPATAQRSATRRVQRSRSSFIAKVGAATAAILAATGGLAVANALPTPIQNAISHLGIGASPHTHQTAPTDNPTPTTFFSLPPNTRDNHGNAVSTIAHNHTSSCAHGATVARIASAQRTHNPHPTCPTTNTTTKQTPTTGAPNHPSNKHSSDTPPPANTRTNQTRGGHPPNNGHTAKSQPNNLGS
jgi:hypothetical protein